MSEMVDQNTSMQAAQWLAANVHRVDDPNNYQDQLLSLEDVQKFLHQHPDAPAEVSQISTSPETWREFLSAAGQPGPEGCDPRVMLFSAVQASGQYGAAPSDAPHQQGEHDVMAASLPPEQPAAPAHAEHGAPPVGGDVPLVHNEAGSRHFQTEFSGHPPNSGVLSSVGQKLGLPSISELKPRIDALGAEGFTSPAHTDEAKFSATYTVLAAMEKIKMMPPSQFGGPESGGINKQAGLVYGSLKMAALAGDAQQVRDILSRNGGNDFGLPDAELLHVWGNAEGWNLHTVIQPGAWLGNAIHMTGLNYADSNPDDGITWNPANASGGYNDTGMASQWGWFDGASQLEAWTR